MQSARTKGAEGCKGQSQYGYHNGSGIFQIKLDGREYEKARYAMDWHALPGLTEEWRTDSIPLSSKDKAYNEDRYAGCLSDGELGLAVFNYSRSSKYSSAAAHKAYFFQDR